MKKSILIIILLMCFFTNAQSKVTGVITYYFNEYQGDKPDIGAKIYIVDSLKLKQKDLDLLRLYNKTKSLQNELLVLKNNFQTDSIAYAYLKLSSLKDADDFYNPRFKNINLDIENIKSQFKKFGFENDREISYLDLKVKNVVDTIKSVAVFTKTIDATGSYVLNLKPNKYFVLIKSNNRHSLTLTENEGNLYFKSIIINNQSEMDVSFNFN